MTMEIDDPVAIAIRQAQEYNSAESYLPAQLTRLGLSAAAAAAFAGVPFVAQIITSLLSNSPARFERRLLAVAIELEAQQQRIEKKIPDIKYYESIEFQSLLTLILERLHVTHQEEKLKAFGDALANSGSVDFEADDTEQYIRILRDLSLGDLNLFRGLASAIKSPGDGLVREQFKESDQASLSRLVGLGLVDEVHGLRRFVGRFPAMPKSSESVSRYAQAIVDAFGDYFKQAPYTSHHISSFGVRFLKFIADNAGTDDTGS